MSASTKAAPDTFTGSVKMLNKHKVHVVSLDKKYEALIDMKDVQQNAARPCKFGGVGTVRKQDGRWVFVPDRI